MKALWRRLVAVRQGDDSGVAIVAAVAVVALVGIMVTVVVTISVSEATQTGRDRQRSSAVSTAEGEVDTMVAQIQSASPAALPALCGTMTDSEQLASDHFALTTTVTYYRVVDTTTVTEVPCASIPTTRVDRAKIVTTAVSDAINGTSPARRTVETMLQLTPAYASGLDKALFSQSALTVSNNTMLTSASGKPDADVYTNGDFYCRNNQEYHGSIQAQGGIYLESQCTVMVDAWAKGQVRVTNPSASIGGRALSSTSSVSLDKAALGQQARAAGSVTGNACSVAGKCVPNQSVPAPPVVAFPQLIWNTTTQAEWTAAGYTNVVKLPSGDFTCGWYNGPDLTGKDGKKANLNGKATGPGAWLFANAWKLPSDTVVMVNCPSDKVVLQGVDIVLNKNLVLLSRLGITMSNTTRMTSLPGTGTAADPHLLYLIQPYGATSGPATWSGTYTCQGDGIALDNQVTVDNTVNTLLYSPCSIRKANKSEIVGQVYSGATLSVDNQFDMTYVPMPIFGLPASEAQIESYSAGVMYKREGL